MNIDKIVKALTSVSPVLHVEISTVNGEDVVHFNIFDALNALEEMKKSDIKRITFSQEFDRYLILIKNTLYQCSPISIYMPNSVRYIVDKPLLTIDNRLIKGWYDLPFSEVEQLISEGALIVIEQYKI